ncbi:hypothetical protein LBE40_05810 [Bartonella taylorii]|uniref:Transmembrane protein n=1 Tax=Bartonella taylorii 8TBB TaxID=1094560 RepID=A0A9P2RXH9_BARTA|nr:hypothetical protein [Bartonella taylorii]EJF92936.1 hypothetical protein ME9_01378 [Bartonella taylorii 8TBB]USP00809.1 hypothetical protein LBE40_05810 [Bartonella taylorii]
MVDFVGILKKAMDAQNNVTPQVRQRIYKRAIETLEHQFVAATIPQAMADEQRQTLQSAIATVEEEYLAIEKELLSSIIGWKSTSIAESHQHTKNSVLPHDHEFSVVVIEGARGRITNSKDKEVFGESVSGLPDAEPVNMNAHFASQHFDKNTLKSLPLDSAPQIDNLHIVSHIFSQAVRRANQSSVQKRIMIGAAIVASLVTLIIGIYFVGGRMFVTNNDQLSEVNVQVSHVLPKAFSVNRKLTQRLLEDGSEVDTGLDQTENSSNEKEISTVVTTNLQSTEQVGEAIFYQARTDYDAEKVAMGSARWMLIKESHMKGAPEELIIQGDITIPDEGLSLRLILRRNTDLSLPAAYIMDLIFNLSDKFSGKVISNVQTLVFKASEHSIGQALARTVTAKIGDNFFLVALSGNHPFLDRNLQLMRELDWVRLVLTDKNGRINELTFAKGPKGESIFNEVIGQWLAQSNKSTHLDKKE